MVPIAHKCNSSASFAFDLKLELTIDQPKDYQISCWAHKRTEGSGQRDGDLEQILGHTKHIFLEEVVVLGVL